MDREFIISPTFFKAFLSGEVRQGFYLDETDNKDMEAALTPYHFIGGCHGITDGKIPLKGLSIEQLQQVTKSIMFTLWMVFDNQDAYPHVFAGIHTPWTMHSSLWGYLNWIVNYLARASFGATWVELQSTAPSRIQKLTEVFFYKLAELFEIFLSWLQNHQLRERRVMAASLKPNDCTEHFVVLSDTDGSGQHSSNKDRLKTWRKDFSKIFSKESLQSSHEYKRTHPAFQHSTPSYLLAQKPIKDITKRPGPKEEDSSGTKKKLRKGEQEGKQLVQLVVAQDSHSAANPAPANLLSLPRAIFEKTKASQRSATAETWYPPKVILNNVPKQVCFHSMHNGCTYKNCKFLHIDVTNRTHTKEALQPIYELVKSRECAPHVKPSQAFEQHMS